MVNTRIPMQQHRAAATNLQSEFPWLNRQAVAALPEPLKRDLETRAVERFFINWILQPRGNGINPDVGFMQFLPLLYEGAPPHSLLPRMIQAMAFADMGRMRNGDGVPFNIKAQRSYGLALNQVLELTHNQRELAIDRTLAALLLIDTFEVRPSWFYTTSA